jgi:hypothetical protein
MTLTPHSEDDLTRRDELLTRLVSLVERLGLRVPVLWFLGVYRPLGALGAQGLLLAQPLLGALTDDRLVRDYALFFEDPDNIDSLLDRLAGMDQ